MISYNQPQSRRYLTYSLPLLIGILVASSLVFYRFREKSSNVLSSVDESSIPIRIGWQIPWATQGQLTQIFKNTDLLTQHGFQGDFKGFSHGGPLNEAALAREVDVVFTADQPAATLLAKDKDWTIIGRLMYNRVSLYVPAKSSIHSVKDLRGKTVGMPFGAAAQRMALKAEREAGLDPDKDVHNVNLGIYEQSDLVRDPEATSWGDIDALAGFDPTPAIFEEKGLIKNLATGKIVSVIVMSNRFIEENPEAPVQFLKAFHGAYDFYGNNIDQANQWFVAESKLDITPEVLGRAADIEPNLSATDAKEIRLGFTEDDYQIMQDAADFLYEQQLVQEKIDMRQYSNMSYLEQALHDLYE